MNFRFNRTVALLHRGHRIIYHVYKEHKNPTLRKYMIQKVNKIECQSEAVLLFHYEMGVAYGTSKQYVAVMFLLFPYTFSSLYIGTE